MKYSIKWVEIWGILFNLFWLSYKYKGIFIENVYSLWFKSRFYIYGKLLLKLLTEVIRWYRQGFPGGSVLKNMPAHSEDIGLIPGLGRSPGGGNGNPL